MPVQSGMRLTPARLNPVALQGPMSGGSYTTTATATDLPGTSITFTVAYDGAICQATWAADFNLTTAGAPNPTGIVQLVVDGTVVSQPQCIWNPSNVAATARVVESQNYTVTLSAGSHTLKLQGSRLGGTGGVLVLNPGHTQLSIFVTP